MSVRHTQRGRRQFVRAASSRGVSIRPPSRFPSAAAGARGSGRIDSGIEQRRGERNKLMARSKLAPSPPRARFAIRGPELP